MNNYRWFKLAVSFFIIVTGFFIINLDTSSIYLMLSSFLFVSSLLLAIYVNKLIIKYMLSLLGFFIYISIIFIFPIKFEMWAQVAFNIPILFAYLFYDIYTPTITAIVLAYIFSSHSETASHIEGAILGILTMSILSTVIGRLFRRITSQRNEYYSMSIRDSLTSLYSLNYCLEYGQSMIDNGNKAMIIILDIDDFKHINDTYGHLVGNNILIQLSNCLTNVLKPYKSILGRLGGDEFIILLCNYSLEESNNIKQLLVENIKNFRFCADKELDLISLGVSLGGAYYDGTSNLKIEELMHSADKNMYINKYNNESSMDSNLLDSKMFPKQSKLYLDVMKEKDMYTYFHSLHTAIYAQDIAEALGKADSFIKDISIAALLHDIGKVLITNDILRKPRTLSDIEYKKVKEHVNYSINILNALDFSKVTINAIKNHHERWDGKGYPNNKKMFEIPIEGRILAIADAYSAMTIKRVYRDSKSHQEALDEIKRNSGTQFDPEIVAVFMNLHSSIMQKVA